MSKMNENKDETLEQKALRQLFSGQAYLAKMGLLLRCFKGF